MGPSDMWGCNQQCAGIVAASSVTWQAVEPLMPGDVAAVAGGGRNAGWLHARQSWPYLRHLLWYQQAGGDQGEVGDRAGRDGLRECQNPVSSACLQMLTLPNPVEQVPALPFTFLHASSRCRPCFSRTITTASLFLGIVSILNRFQHHLSDVLTTQNRAPMMSCMGCGSTHPSRT